VKRNVVAGAAALTLVGASLGIAAAQQAMDQTRTELGIQGPGGPNPGDHRQGGGPNGGGQRIGGGFDAAAQALGIGVDQLRQELQGQTLTQVAQAHNVDPTTVANALKQAANSHIDQEAAAGQISTDQVATTKQQAADRIDQMMSQAVPTGRPAASEPTDRGAAGRAPGPAPLAPRSSHPRFSLRAGPFEAWPARAPWMSQ
jgi:hypothetical protein